jgi:predicted metal-dependent peptidase
MAMEKALKRLIAARTGLVLDQPFLGALALRLKLVEDSTCKTAWTDGTSLGYSTEFVEACTHDELKALVCHEVMHCAFGHPWRRDLREQKRWNVACDYAVNPVLTDVGFQLPEGALNDVLYVGKSSEWIYDRLPTSSSASDGDGSGDGEPNPLGEVRDAPAQGSGPDDAPVTESDWKQAVQEAAMGAKVRGDLPVALARFASENAEPPVDWKSVLRRFVQDVAKGDYSWQRPNPRYVGAGLYLPSLRSEELGPIVVAIDTSGSVDAVLLGQFESEIRAIADEARPSRVYVMYADSKVQRRDTFERDDLVELHMHGGGGTDFRPVFEAVGQMDEEPACVIYLTDLAGRFPETEPEVPVLWGSVDSHRDAPFGEVVPVVK